jgi:hypothetical protein
MSDPRDYADPADVEEQETPVDEEPESSWEVPGLREDADEADLLEQASDVPVDEDDYREDAG